MANTYQTSPLPAINDAAKQHFDHVGSLLTTNNVLKWLLLLALLVIGWLAWNTTRLATIAANVKPLVVRVNDVGRAEAVKTNDLHYVVHPEEVKFHLSRFVEGFYGRERATVRKNYTDSLYFLDTSLYSIVNSRDINSQWLAKFLSSNSEDEAEVVNPQVVIENLEKEPYSARIEFQRVFRNQAAQETKTERWEVEAVFRFNPSVTGDMVEHNPLGMAITYFHEDKFSGERK